MLVGGIWLVAAMLIINFFAGAYQNNRERGLEVRYIDFDNSKVLDNKPTQFDEIRVVERELDEFKTAVIKLDFDNAIEEYHDVKQSMENTLQLMGVPKEYLISGQPKHYRKLKKRGWLFKE